MEKKLVHESIDKLLIIQERDNRINRGQNELNDIPVRKKEIEQRNVQCRAELEKAKEALKTRQAAIRQVEVEIEAHKQQINRFREQQLQIKTNEEYRVLNHEIAHVQEQIRGLEDREIGLMEDVERAQADLAQAKDRLARDESEINAAVSRLEERYRNLNVEIQQLQQDRAGLAAGVAPAWLARYNRLMENKKDMALVPVDNGGCGGCHMKLPSYVIHEVRRSESIISCNFCGRVLYWTR